MQASAKIIEDISQLLSRTGYFKGISSDILIRLAQYSKFRQLKRGDVLIAEGATIDSNVYVVLEGQIHLILPTLNSIRSLRFIGPGMTLGESTLLMQMAPPYRAVATRNTQILVIHGLGWLREVDSTPELCKAVLKHIAQRMLNTMHMLVVSSSGNDLSRVVSYVMDFRPSIESEDFSFKLPARKMDIAASLAMSRESFSRVLQRLRNAGLIHVSGAYLHVLKATQLNNLTNVHSDSQAILSDTPATFKNRIGVLAAPAR